MKGESNMRISKILALLLVIMVCLCGCLCGCDNGSNTKKPSSKVNDKSGSSADAKKEESDETEEEKPGKKVEITVGMMYDSFVTPDGSDPEDTDFVESGTSVSTLSTNWEGPYKMSGNSDKLASEYRNKVLSAKNTKDNYSWSGTTYYVSPSGNDKNDGKSPAKAVKTLDADIFVMDVLKPGDAVLFERGGLWRMRHSISTADGVTYGSYGSGEKPTFYGSAYNYADSSYWSPSRKQYVWKVSISDYDIGLAVFNHGEMTGIKKTTGLTSLGKNGDFYFNQKEDLLYLYYDKGNPGECFKDIELGLRIAGFSVNSDDTVIDNFRIKYFGAFGISLGGSNNSKITNCELGYIGGAMQNETVRYGNAIQHWNGGDGHLVENCWVYQIYDTGLTWQGNSYWNPGYKIRNDYNNFVYRNNLIEYCSMSFEFWHDTAETEDSSGAVINGFICEKNISRFAGYGFGKQRPDPNGVHIKVGKRCFPQAVNNRISDNIFDLCSRFIVDWEFKKGQNNGIWDISNNTYYHGKNTKNEAIWFGNTNLGAENQADLEYALNIFEKTPALIKWVG